MHKLVLGMLVGMSVLVQGCCRSPEADFKKLCRISAEVAADRSIERPMMASEVHKRFGSPLLSKAARQCTEAVFPANIAPAQKYATIEMCARESGVDNWSCEPLKWIWTAPPGAPVPVWKE